MTKQTEYRVIIPGDSRKWEYRTLRAAVARRDATSRSTGILCEVIKIGRGLMSDAEIRAAVRGDTTYADVRRVNG